MNVRSHALVKPRPHRPLLGDRQPPDLVVGTSTINERPSIRTYAETFQDVLVGHEQTADRLFDDIAEAWTSADVADKVSGAFSAVSTSMGPLGPIPGVGTVTGIVGMADLAPAPG